MNPVKILGWIIVAAFVCGLIAVITGMGVMLRGGAPFTH